jgi:hypothetical protein
LPLVTEEGTAINNGEPERRAYRNAIVRRNRRLDWQTHRALLTWRSRFALWEAVRALNVRYRAG